MNMSHLKSIIAEALTTKVPLEEGVLALHFHDCRRLLDGLLEWQGFDTSIAIGHFDENGKCAKDFASGVRKLGPNEAEDCSGWPVLHGIGVEEGDSGGWCGRG